MSCSPARLEANRQNALKSTGPKSAEGKAASRLNAFKHGMAGQGDIAGPGDDLAVVADLSAKIAEQLKAPGEIGRLLADRVAMLSVRMERLAQREMVAVAANSEQARAAFDAEFAEETDGLIASLSGPGDPKPALAALQETPDGVARLIAAWGELRDRIDGPDDACRQDWMDRAKSRLGLSEQETAALSEGEIARRIDAEIARLRELADSMTDIAEAIAQARTRVGIMARFDPSPEATLARRYEAAAERGVYRGLKAIAELNKGKDQAPAPDESSHIRSTPPAISPELPAPLIPPTQSNPSLGSFRAASLPTSPVVGRSPEERKNRPDLKQAARKLASSRR